MPTTPYATYSVNRLVPAFPSYDEKTMAATLVPGQYAAGTVLGQLTSANVNDVQTITISGSPTGGTFTLTVTFPGSNTSQTTAAIAYNATAAAVQAALVAVLGDSTGVAVTGTGPYVATFGNTYGNQTIPVMTATGAFTGGTSPSVAVAHTTAGVGPQYAYKPYASGNSDGSQNAQLFLEYDCTVDHGGNVTLGTPPGAPWAATTGTAPAYFAGVFNTAQLVGLDSTAVTALKGVIKSGTVANGLIEI